MVSFSCVLNILYLLPTLQVAAELLPQQQKGWAPRPRSKNAPKPAALVSYGENAGEVQRNTMDNIDLDGPTMEELILQNAESMKQFEYLEKSLVTFQSAVSAQTAELRQPIVRGLTPLLHFALRTSLLLTLHLYHRTAGNGGSSLGRAPG